MRRQLCGRLAPAGGAVAAVQRRGRIGQDHGRVLSAGRWVVENEQLGSEWKEEMMEVGSGKWEVEMMSEWKMASGKLESEWKEGMTQEMEGKWEVNEIMMRVENAKIGKWERGKKEMME